MRLSLLVLGVVFGLMCAAQGVPQTFRTIKPGTSEPDVIKQVGEPQRIEKFATVKNNSFDTTRYWRYSNDVIIIFTNHAVDAVVAKWDVVLKRIQQRAARKDEEGLTIVTLP